MNSKTSTQLKNAAQAFLNGEAVESFEGQDDQYRTVEAWLFEAWSCGTVDGTLEALLRVQELDPENDLAQRGLDWADGLSSLAQEVLTRDESSLELEDEFGEVAESDEANCSELESGEDEDPSKTTLFGFEIASVFDADDEPTQTEPECTAEETALAIEPNTDEAEASEAGEDGAESTASDALLSLETLFKPTFSADTEDALTNHDTQDDSFAQESDAEDAELHVEDDTEAESAEEVVFWAGESEADATSEEPIAEQEESEAEAEAQRLADEAESQRLVEESEALRLANEAEELRLAEEAEAQRLADEAEELRLAEEAEAQRLADEKAEAQQLADAAEAQRLAEEAEAQRLADEEAKAQQLAEEAEQAEAQRLADEAEELRLAEEAEAQRLAEEVEAQRLAEEVEAQRLAEEVEAQRLAEEAEAQRLAEEAEAQRLAEEAEAQRLAEEAEAQRVAEEAEAQRQADEILALQQAEELHRAEETAAAEVSQDLASRDIMPTIMFDPTQPSPLNEGDESLEAVSEVTLDAAPVTAEVVEEEIHQSIDELSNEIGEVVADITPAVSETPENDTSESGEPKADGPLVMAVDDSPTIRKLVSMTLEREGFRVVTAADGLEALQLLSDHMPDIILSDVNMPRLDGYKLCRFVKKHERTKHIPVVMLSGKDGVFDKLRGKMFGCGDYITKPFDSADLVEKVRLHTGSYTS